MLNFARLTTRRPSAAMVIAIIALISSLTGTAFAAGVLPAGSVASKQLRTWAVTTPKVKNQAITARKLHANAVNSSKVANRSLLAVDFAHGQLPTGVKGDTGATGAVGPAGSAVAYARVPEGVTPTFAASATKSFTAIVRSSTGTYCLTPAAGIIPTAHPAVVSVEQGGALRPVALATVEASAQPLGCAAGDYKVETYRIYVEANGGPMLTDDVAFSIIAA